uniref:Sperm-tail PG-rich repeat containing 4 n=1 Tax=Dromaius novaehollandiae TaxID=8790 RepID=A0A8C4J8Q2_DRONO
CRQATTVLSKLVVFREHLTQLHFISEAGRKRIQYSTLCLFSSPTPIPGTYAVQDFLQEAQLNPVKPMYSFKGEGRRRIPIYKRTADNSLPSVSAYVPPTFIDLAGKKLAMYSFKNLPRRSPSTLCFKDKVNIYTIIASFSKPRQFMFRSAVQRSSNNYFIPKEGPGPGHYEIKKERSRTVGSCFQSKVPRMLPVRSVNTPGPGAYEPTRQFPKQPRTIASLGQEHSIFFSTTDGF